MPIINSLKPGVSKLVLAEMQKNGVRGTKDQIQEAHAKRVKRLVSLGVYILFSRLISCLVDHPSKTVILRIQL